MTPSQQCDQMLDELSLLMYGLTYAELGPRTQCEVIAEACFRFTANQLHGADLARKAEREN